MASAQVAVRHKRRRMTTAEKREALAGYAFISPWIIGFLVFVLGSMAASLYISFQQWDMLSPMEFYGFRNYERMFRDKYFWISLSVTLRYTVFAVPLGIACGFGIALLMNQKIKGLSIWRTVYYLPAVISGIAVSLLWVWVFNPDFGLLNGALRTIGISNPPNWLGTKEWALPSFIVMSLWSAGGGMVIYLAGLQSIPTELYEAATLDGAGRFKQFIHVTIPMMTPVLFFQLIMGMINSLQIFQQAYIMTNGGPDNGTLFYVLNLYNQAFRSFKMGYASALAWMLFVVILGLTLLVFGTSNRWVHYSNE